MKTTIKLNESQFKNLVDLLEQDIKIIGNPEELPNIVTQLQKIVGEGKQKVRTILDLLLDRNPREMVENREKYLNYLETMRSLEKEYQNKYNKYFDLVERFDDDYYDNKLSGEHSQYYKQADKLVGDLDNIQTDLTKLVDKYDELLNLLNVEDINYFMKNYPLKNIEI
jgi:hypothetical protein